MNHVDKEILEWVKSIDNNQKKCCKQLLSRLDDIDRKLDKIEHQIQEILAILKKPPATGGTIIQIGVNMPTNLSIDAGKTGVFLVTWNGAMLAGAPVTWTSSDPAVVPVNDPSDPSGNTADVPVPATDTSPNFVLTASGTNSANQPVSAAATITINQPAVPATGGTITQLS